MDDCEKDNLAFSSPFKGIQVEWNSNSNDGTNFDHTTPNKSNPNLRKKALLSKIYHRRCLGTLKTTSATEDSNFISEVMALSSKSEKSEKLARIHDNYKSPECCYDFTPKFIEKRVQKADRRLRKKLRKQHEQILEEDTCSELLEEP